MDVKELQENCNCAKCVHCFDEYDHYKMIFGAPLLRDSTRFYCNEKHEYVNPQQTKECFKQW